MKHFGTLIRLAREAKGVRQFELARQIGVSAAALSLMETGQQPLTVELAGRLAAALGLEAEDLFSETEAAHAN